MSSHLIAFLIVLFASCDGFRVFRFGIPGTRTVATKLSMTNTFGVQKLGEQIIGAPTVTQVPETEAPGIFRRSSTGSGRDERFSAKDLSQELETSRNMMVGIGKSFRQQSLMMTLSSDSILGFVDKAERVRIATTEGLLPMSMNTDMVAGSALASGGLFKDWEFDM